METTALGSIICLGEKEDEREQTVRKFLHRSCKQNIGVFKIYQCLQETLGLVLDDPGEECAEKTPSGSRKCLRYRWNARGQGSVANKGR